MGAEENVETMRRAYDAFNKADIDALNEAFDESAVWHAPGRTPLAGDYEGREATFAYLGGLGEKTDGTFRANLRQLVAGEDGLVVGVQRSTAERAGKSLDVANASSSSSRAAGLPRFGSTLTTSTLGTSSGRSPSARARGKVS